MIINLPKINEIVESLNSINTKKGFFRPKPENGLRMAITGAAQKVENNVGERGRIDNLEYSTNSILDAVNTLSLKMGQTIEEALTMRGTAVPPRKPITLEALRNGELPNIHERPTGYAHDDVVQAIDDQGKMIPMVWKKDKNPSHTHFHLKTDTYCKTRSQPPYLSTCQIPFVIYLSPAPQNY